MPSDIVRAQVPTPRDTLEEIDRMVGRRGRGQFLTEAVDEKLRRLQMAEAVSKVSGVLANVDTPGWNTPEEVLAWVHAQRRDRERRPNASG
jgi:hypothetical protein